MPPFGGIFYIKENIIMDSKFIEINGLKIHYVENNEQESNIVFFLHGNSGSRPTCRNLTALC